MAENKGEAVIYVNQEEGLKRVMNNAKLYVRLLNKFKVDINVEDLIAMVEAGDYEKAQGLAHTVKGTAANLSLIELFKQSLDLETQIKNRAVKPEALQDIKICFDKTLAAIDTVVKQYG